MIKPIMKDVLFLAQKSEPATAKNKNIAIDLLDTLQANADRCVGMAANMIGERKRIIVFNLGKTNVVMFNPVIVKKDKPYETEEGCSRDGSCPKGWISRRPLSSAWSWASTMVWSARGRAPS